MATPLPPCVPHARFLLGIPINETARYTLILSCIRLSLNNGWVGAEGRIDYRYSMKNAYCSARGWDKNGIPTEIPLRRPESK